MALLEQGQTILRTRGGEPRFMWIFVKARRFQLNEGRIWENKFFTDWWIGPDFLNLVIFADKFLV